MDTREGIETKRMLHRAGVSNTSPICLGTLERGRGGGGGSTDPFALCQVSSALFTEVPLTPAVCNYEKIHMKF